jgi:anti-sigma regulatory factor (Ser/Thr protein kinase)
MKLRFPIAGGDFLRAGEGSSRLMRTLQQLGIDGGLVRRICIVAYELEMNVAIHAESGELAVQITPSSVTLVCKDRGLGIPNLELAMQEGYSTASQEARELGFGAGMGLPNIRRSADTLEIDSAPGQGTTITATINL